MKAKLFFVFTFMSMVITTAFAQDEQETSVTFDMGNFEVSTLSEGAGQGNQNLLIGATDEMIRETMPDGTYPTTISAFLVNISGKKILVDAAFEKNLFRNLSDVGTTPEEVEVILLTHMHGDHIGGLLRDGKVAFPNAELYISKIEHDYWMENENENAKGAKNVIAAYKDKLHLFTPNEVENVSMELIPGVKAIAAYGHTPGHTMYLVESDGDRLLIWGDLTHAMAIQMPYPEVVLRYDVNPDMAIESRKKVLEYVTKKNLRIAGMHVPYPSIGNIKPNNKGGYVFSLLCACEGK